MDDESKELKELRAKFGDMNTLDLYRKIEQLDTRYKRAKLAVRQLRQKILYMMRF